MYGGMGMSLRIVSDMPVRIVVKNSVNHMFDFEHSLNEDRYIAIGRVGDVLFVVFTERKETIRLVSARLATNAEKELYYDQDIYH